MLRRCILFWFISLFFGCADSPPNARPQTSPESREKPDVQPISLTFGGYKWVLVLPPASSGDVWRPGMEARAYKTNVPNLRLLELIPATGAETRDHVYARLLQTQQLVNARWISHGRGEYWYLDGCREVNESRNGQSHGSRKIWYENGNLKLSEVYIDGKLSGVCRGWYENGQLQWEATYLDDKEISGQSWDREGIPN